MNTIFKFITTFVFAICLMFTGINCSVAGDTTLLVPAEKQNVVKKEYYGVYVAPRFSFDFEHFNPKKGGSQTNDMVYNSGLGLAVGYDFSKNYDVPVRFEVEYLNTMLGSSYYKKFGDYSFKRENQYLLANVIWDIHNFQIDDEGDFVLTPFVGVGVGADFTKSTVKHNGVKHTNYDQLACYDAQAGVSLNMYKDWNIDLGYKFIQSGLLRNNGVESTTNYDHLIQVGLRYTF